MELIKTNENYSISDKTEKGWIITGNASYETNGSLNINISINSNIEDHIGNFSYNKWSENDTIHISYNVKEENRNDLVAYSDILIKWVLEQFKYVKNDQRYVTKIHR